LNAALGRLFTATARGHVPPKTTRTLAYFAQVMVQCIHITQKEYAGAFGGDGWRNSIRSSVNSNSDYLYPAPCPRASVPSPWPPTHRSATVQRGPRFFLVFNPETPVPTSPAPLPPHKPLQSRP